jgi:hypothetical protein
MTSLVVQLCIRIKEAVILGPTFQLVQISYLPWLHCCIDGLACLQFRLLRVRCLQTEKLYMYQQNLQTER